MPEQAEMGGFPKQGISWGGDGVISGAASPQVHVCELLCWVYCQGAGLGLAGFCLPQSTQAGRHWEGSPGLCCTVGLSLQLQPEPDFCLICNGRAPSGATSNPLCLFLFFFFFFFILLLYV